MLVRMIRAALTCMALALATALMMAGDGGPSSESQGVNDSGDSGTGASIANAARCCGGGGGGGGGSGEVLWRRRRGGALAEGRRAARRRWKALLHRTEVHAVKPHERRPTLRDEPTTRSHRKADLRASRTIARGR